MSQNSRLEVTLGKKYGHLTVLETKAPSETDRRWLYRCNCDCGRETFVTAHQLLCNKNLSCIVCAPKRRGQRQREKTAAQLLGKEINGWYVVKAIEIKCGKQMFECKCLRCNNISVLDSSHLKYSKTAWCAKCTPNYNFVIWGSTAQGCLSDGTLFWVDTEDIPLINRHYWFVNHEGYIVAQKSDRKGHLRLHRYILGVSDVKKFVDHINRDRLDCRKANLRIVNPAQNCYNHSKLSSNKSGFIGVYYSTCSKRYEVKIGIGGRHLLLGSSETNTVRLAHMYNIAAEYLFGDYVGELNQVPKPNQELVQQIELKCQNYISVHNITAPVSIGAVAI